MTTSVVLHAGETHFKLSGPVNEQRPVNPADWKTFHRWSITYRDLVARKPASYRQSLIELGQDIHAWLDGSAAWMQRLRPQITAQLSFEFRVDAGNLDLATSFFDVPWELIHDDDGFWVAHSEIQMAPLRRIGTPQPDQRRPPSMQRLQVIFMATTPPPRSCARSATEPACRASRRLSIKPSGTG